MRAEEWSDIRTYAAVEVVRDIMLFGATPEEAKASIMTTVLGDGFIQSIHMVADEMGFAIDPEIRVTHETAVATAPIACPMGEIEPGRVAGAALHVAGDGRRRAGDQRHRELADGRRAPRPGVDVRSEG